MHIAKDSSDRRFITVRLREYTVDPGVRLGNQLPDGANNSGEQFRIDIVEPAFKLADESGFVLIVDIGGTWGVTASFRNEVFAGLVRSHWKCSDQYRFEMCDYKERLIIISDDGDDIVSAWNDIEDEIRIQRTGV